MNYIRSDSSEPLSGFWDKLGSGIKKAGGWAVNTYGSAQQAAGKAEVAQEIAQQQANALALAQQAQSSSPLKRALPFIAIGGAGLLLYFVIRKK